MTDVLRAMRDRKLAELQMLIPRPGMAPGRHSVHSFLSGILQDLGELDGRDEEVEVSLEALGIFGKAGVHGAFSAVFGDDGDYGAELASVFAAIAAGLGYLDVGSTLGDAEWERHFVNARDLYEERDFRRSDVVDALGDPSLVIDRRVLCYVSSAGCWGYVDCWEERQGRYDPDLGTFRYESPEDPLVRNLRLPADTFDDSLVLTHYGKVIRWGPDWHLYHEPRLGSSPPGVRDQLIGIQQADPSQHLRPRRP